MAKTYPKRGPSSRSAGKLADLSIRHPKFQKLLLALHSAPDARAFLRAVERLIRAAIPCDAVHTLLHGSPESAAPPAARGGDGTDPGNGPIRGGSLGAPSNRVLATGPGGRARPLEACYASQVEMGGDPFLDEYIRRMGVRHAVVMPLWRKSVNGADLVIGARRASGGGEFTREEMAIMETLHPHIDIAYRRVHRLQTEAGALLGLEQCLAPLPLPTALLDWELAPFFFNPSAREAVSRWSGVDPHLKTACERLRLPPDLLGLLRAMREQWTALLWDGGGMAALPERVVEHPTEPGLRVRVSLTALASPHFGKPSFVVRFEHDRPGRNGKLAAVARMSPCERKIVDRVCNGESNQEIADAMGRSVNTIKSALHEIFLKLGVDSRARLIARLQ